MHIMWHVHVLVVTLRDSPFPHPTSPYQPPYACRYGRHELTTSDHRPVGAALAVAVAVAVPERRHAVHSEILRSLDAWENECMPMAQLETHELCYGAVRFDQPALRPSPHTRTLGTGVIRSLHYHTPCHTPCRPPSQPRPHAPPLHPLLSPQVRFGEPARRALPLKNVGQTTLQFSFQPLPQALQP